MEDLKAIHDDIIFQLSSSNGVTAISIYKLLSRITIYLQDIKTNNDSTDTSGMTDQIVKLKNEIISLTVKNEDLKNRVDHGDKTINEQSALLWGFSTALQLPDSLTFIEKVPVAAKLMQELLLLRSKVK